MKKISLALTILFLGLQAISQNPLLLKDVYPGITGSGIQQIVKTSNYTFFNAEDDDPDLDRGLYRTDGTVGGTIKLNLSYLPDPPPSPNNYLSTKAEKLTALGNKIIFAGDNFPNYGEIWASDGTQAGTIAIERFQPTTTNVSPIVEISAMGSYAYYSAVNNSNQAILKRTDGTVAGTSEIYNFGAYTGIASVVFLTPINNILYFIVYDRYGTGVDQLWRSDGTTAGTYMVYDFGLTQYVASFIMPAGNNMYIMTVVPGTGNVLWKSDGTAAGSMNVKTIASSGNNNYPAFAAIGSTFYFGGLDGNGKELWKSDGTAAGTVMVADINPGAASSNPLFMTALNNNLYFAATTVAEGTELWKYDGSTASLVKDINPGTANSASGSLVVSNNTIVFRATTLTDGSELWITDGTTANTLPVANINPGAASSTPNFLTPGNPIYFSANNGVSGAEIFAYDNSQSISGLRKIYVNDNSTTGDVFTTAIGNNANLGTKAAPVATITHALSIALAGDTIVVDAGAFAEQVIIDKGITIKGAGQNLTSFIPPATPLVPAPGPFTEIGLFETIQGIGDVHISDLSINSNNASQNIIIQSGGSVKNCRLQNGGQGIFFRIESTVKTALVENNIIEPQGIGINCQGSGLTATIRNNTITRTAGYYAGIFAGLDFGPLPQLTIHNNIISNYFGIGLEVNSFTGNYNNNSIAGSGGLSIRRSSGNTPNATCNWYGSPLAATVTSKISGVVTYSPWLINGTDNSTANGFQPTQESCAGGANSFYVNDSSQAGNVFTIAAGNNTNPGTFNAPFATLNYAISQAPAGATIYVDAGTYVENVIVNKSLTLRGAKYGQNPGSSLNRGDESVIIPASTNTSFSGMIMQPAADNIIIDGFMLDGDNPALTNGTIVNGVDVNVAFGIYNNAIAASYLTVKNNIVKNAVTYGIGLFRALGNTTGPVMPGALFTQNRVDNASRGIVLAYNAYGNITNNYISRCSGSGTWFSQHRVANLNNSPSYVSGNTIENCGQGMQSSSLEPAASIVHYLNNDITGISTSFAGISLLINNTAGVVLSNNKITGPSVGVYINSTNSLSPVLVNNNSFSSITTYAIQSVSAFPINATCNWFSTNSATTIQAKVLGNVNYTPWLINGTDSDPATGFQPLANNCLGQPKYYVNDNSLSSDVFTTAVGSNSNNGSSSSPFATLEFAYSIAQPGDTIYVDAGTYVMANLVMNKAITILGTNYEISPNNPADKKQYNTGRNAEARITGGTFIIGADWIFINGLRISSNTAISLNGDYSHIKFNKNLFDVASAANTVQLQGISTGPIVAFDFMATDNRFERTDNLTGTALFLSAVKNLWIDDNVFIESGAVVNRSIAIRTSTTTAVESVLISNNYLKKLSNAIATSILQTSTISNNRFDSCAQGIIFTPINVVSNHVFINSNTFTNLRVGRSVLIRGGNLAGINNLNVNNNIINQNIEGINGIVSMIQLEFAAGNTFGTVNVLNNKITITGDYNFNGIGSNCGIQLTGKHANTNIAGNELNFSAINARVGLTPGILPPVPAGVYINTDALPSSAVINITNNMINGFKQSVVFYDPAAGTTPAIGYGYLATGAAVAINNNSFIGDSISVDNGTISQTVNATCNWYGSAAAQQVLPKISATTVNYIPWLVNGTDNDIATGFQPVPGNCNGTPVAVSFNASTNVSCFGGNNGSISITVSGGSAPYNFNWSRNGIAGYSTVEDPANLVAGTYDLIITDANGSTASLNGIIISEPAQLTATATGTSTSCSNSASVVAAGGTTPYTYLWSNGATTATVINLPAGIYSVIVTDTKGCTATASVTVTANEAFNPAASVADVSCFGGSNGSITVTNVNSIAPFEFSIDGINFQPGTLPYSFNNLTAGTYTIAVRDANGCTGFVTKTINQPPLLSVVVNNVQNTCYGQSSGAINVTVSGGSGALNYSWTGPNGFTSTQRNISNLVTGSYSFTVTDNNGCTSNLTVAVPSFNEITVSAVITNVLCRGGSTGAINLTVSGGSNSGFSFAWSGGSTSTTEDIFNLSFGNYNVAITDLGSGCVVTRSYTITQPASNLSLATVKTNATGCNSLGTITATGSGGTSPYQYRIGNGSLQSLGLFTNLYGGTYIVWVQDANGCITSKEVIITDNGSDEYENNNSKNQAKPILIAAAINARIATAADAADWFKFVTPAGGGNFILSFTHPSATFTFNMYAAGNNTPPLVPVNTTATTKEYVLSGNTTYYIGVTGGLSYSCYELMVSPPTTFAEIITSGNNTQGSSGNNSTIIKTPDPVVADVLSLNAIAYPNPHQGTFNLRITSPETGMVKIELFTGTGQKLQEKTVSVQKTGTAIVPFNVAQHGTVFYRVQIGKYIITGKVIGIK